jgi:hypothetical protein
VRKEKKNRGYEKENNETSGSNKICFSQDKK